ncbi:MULTISPECIES: aldehyde dehydrogenase family protein [Rhodococcus]|uniref:Aldehyde dehydrogenase family protein n=1 Tax=Rhodococcus oxybenzonivorans TaxID=1990687 RepID=A0AAE5A6T4_9NOCA|nr:MULTISPECIES: aldehyde dehydrogenase family protein [Rhodococcus]MDV7241853.1 aldehyde dehydrogenase family protein [Rhodococcus oxybenzonivorans]MDV7265493.1 aldehyde dehydrogenase family protein [Rhodococcus oxybenzonivorans]MDV7273613.1 aldehyde dehydrogenase family protein [Rhodococcus oxybenzonivorans]MDV7334135.1 aldehyde dehydrogenase family protein [Rhodococcus oxybenzonivorans]MDV7343554.1 aldehyde dehydrogenase family protein [Rhodococcus oxybenzonivorans]
MVSTYEGRLFIDGEFRESASRRTYDVINPADESVVARAADADVEDVRAAIAAARRFADESEWGTEHEFRRKCMLQLQQGLRDRSDEIKTLLTAEAGVCASNMITHVDVMIDGMDFFNELTTAFQWEEDLPPYDILGNLSARRIRYEPYGVVGAITPWNAPFMTAIWKVHHALATGNAVVLKSAPDTPLTAALIAEVVRDSTDIPKGAFHAISSADKSAVGDAMTADQRIDLYHFTGSPGVGQRIAQRAAVGIRHTVLELGGKSANILLPDADLDMACGLGVVMCMANSGQGCALATRMVVHADIYDDVLHRLTELIGNLPWGDPTDPANMVGPIIRGEQLQRVKGLVDRARESGARLLVGGKEGSRFERGFWYEPTLLADVDENSEIAQTEVFGPVLSVIRYDGDDDEAVRVANNSPYGLSAYVQSSDEERAWAVARKLLAGTVNINNSFYLSPDAPFGGYGISGDGVEHGVAGFREYLRIKSIASPAK